MAVNGAWLFGTDGINIDSFSIASNGTLRQLDSHAAGNTSGGPGNVFLDHAGLSLYDGYYNLNGTGNNGYQAYSIDNSSGKITYINDVTGGPSIGSVLSLVGNNEFAYSSSCYHFTPAIFGIRRHSDGSITDLTTNPPMPTAPSGDFYRP